MSNSWQSLQRIRFCQHNYSSGTEMDPQEKLFGTASSFSSSLTPTLSTLLKLNTIWSLDHIDHIYFLCWILAIFWQWKPVRLLTFIPCRFPLIPVPPTGFTGWRGPILQSRAPRGICRNSQIGPRRSSGGPPLMIIVVPAALGLDHHVCLLAIVEHQVRPEKASKDKKLAFFYLVNGLELA